MKYILNWNKNNKTYSMRRASSEEEARIKKAVALMATLKSLNQQVQKDAFECGMPLDVYIDNEAYYFISQTNKIVEEIKTLTEGLIELDYSKYLLYL